MSVERSIQAAVARADLIVCAALRVLGVAAILGDVLPSRLSGSGMCISLTIV